MLFHFDEKYYSRNTKNLCGVDEVGRGPLAGPVVAAAVIVPRGIVIDGLRDSKELTPKRRAAIALEIKKKARAWSIGIASPREIEELNIHNASLIAMKRAVLGLDFPFDLLLVDGRHRIPLDFPQTPLIKGDSLSAHIAAASVVAKVARDAIMVGYHEKYPEYNFFKNKGYGTREHREAIKRHGITPIHRITFSGVKEFVA